jgi:predicted ribosome quality control (RQC) complex YloA/Tae2 family protein
VAELSGFEVLVLVKEISSALRGAYVNNIYSIGDSQLIRFRKQGAEDAWLVASPKKGVWISSKVSERAETTEFTSKLRSEFERTRFSGASQADLDRVFILDFEDGDKRRLVVELMPPGNIVVTDAEGRVRLALAEVRSESRRVVRGSIYEPPKQTRLSPLKVTPDDAATMIRSEASAGKAIGRHVALPRKYVTEALTMLGVEEHSPSSNLVGREEEVTEVLREMVEYSRDSPEPCICQTQKGDEIYVFHPQELEVKETASTVSALCDKLFLEEAIAGTEAISPEDAKRKELEVTVSRLKSESESLLGQAAKIRSAAQKTRSSTLKEAARLLADLRVHGGKEPSSSAAVASLLYDKAKQLETKSRQNLEAAARLERRILKPGLRKAPRTKPLARRKQEWYEKFRWLFTGEGKLAIGGRDAQTNSILVRRHLDEGDTVYHADLFGSPFFVLKDGRRQTEEEVREVAQATVTYSSAWKTGLGYADAYWVTTDQVSTAAPSGEYLQRGSFTIRGRKNYVTKNMLEIAVGLDSDGKLMAGPEEAVRRRCSHYVVLRPQREKGSDTAKRVLKELGTVAGKPGQPLSLDDVQRALPTGGGKIVRRR